MKKLILISLVAFFACKNSKPVQESGLSVEEEKLEKLKALKNNPSSSYTYHEFRSDTVTTEEKQSVLIEQMSDGRYLSTELYNIYVSEDKITEYYVLEMKLDPVDTTQRQKVLDYRLFEAPDSVFLASRDVTEILIRDHFSLHSNHKEYEVFLLNGYSHEGDPDPVNYRFWSPEYGTLLIWYGEDITYELVDTGNPSEEEILLNLRSQIKRYLSD